MHVTTTGIDGNVPKILCLRRVGGRGRRTVFHRGCEGRQGCKNSPEGIWARVLPPSPWSTRRKTSSKQSRVDKGTIYRGFGAILSRKHFSRKEGRCGRNRLCPSHRSSCRRLPRASLLSGRRCWGLLTRWQPVTVIRPCDPSSTSFRMIGKSVDSSADPRVRPQLQSPLKLLEGGDGIQTGRLKKSFRQPLDIR